MVQTTIDYQSELSSILKRKAIGPKGSRHLDEDDLPVINGALKSQEVSLTGKAVLVASVIILERNPLEEQLLDQWRLQDGLLSDPLVNLFFGEYEYGFPRILKKILRDIDLNADEASAAILHLLNPNIPDYQKAVFLIGERLKRETFEENSAFLQTMRQHADTRPVNVPLLIDLSDPYDGFQRYPIYTPFVASVLGAMGFPAYCHGTKNMAPKNGDTIYNILELAGKNPLKISSDVVKDIENREIGWGYIDQSIYFPGINGLTELREKMVKRPFLATLEKLLQPLRSVGKNYLVAGFVHGHYKQELADLLADQKPLNTAFIVKGMEGSSQIDFRKKPETLAVKNGHRLAGNLTSDQIDYPKNEWQQCDSLAEYSLETGTAALQGEKNDVRNILINQVMLTAAGLQILDRAEARLEAEKAIDSGRAYRHWQNGG